MTDRPEGRSRWAAQAEVTGSSYDKAWERLSASGENPHGEADLVESLAVSSVLDAGCGTGRLAIELARRGHRTVGVDLDDRMLDTARQKAPHLEWIDADLAELNLVDPAGERRRFDVVASVGNVMIFLAPGTEATVLARLAAHVAHGGFLVAGFQLRPGGLTVEAYDTLASAAGLELVERFSTWSRDPFVAPGDYAVSIHGTDS